MSEIGPIRGLSMLPLISFSFVVFRPHFRQPVVLRSEFPRHGFFPEPWLRAHVGGARRSYTPTTAAMTPLHIIRKDETMGFFSKDIKSLDDLFVHTLRDIYYAEKEIKKALPDMIDKATNPELRKGFELHLKQTEGHIDRVEEVFEMHGVKAKAVNCPAIDGIIEEANDVVGEVDDKQVLDSALIAAAQAVEHYEITRYGTLIEWAKQLGRDDCASVLRQNLDEEKATDKKLTTLAESKINLQAAE
jgi:ferritin-like metal-binding protein YciE